jgi:hypothetical protein
MVRRLRQTLMDYMVIGISPALIMGMVGSLLFFLLTVFYHGQYAGRLNFIFAMFTMAVVLIARISMERGIEYASVFAIALAVVTALAMARFVQIEGPLAGFSNLINWGLIAIVWWSAHKLTWDCTFIDDQQDASGEGLLQAVGFDSETVERQVNAVQSGGAQSPDSAHNGRHSATVRHGGPDWYQRMVERRRRPHTPGVWVMYYALAALPLFGAGQWLIPAFDTASRLHAFRLICVYVACALGLLLTTSFLGLRRYLRQRNLQMPADMAGLWLGLGAVMIVAVLLVCVFLPRPGASLTVSQLPFGLGSPDQRRTSPHAFGNDGPERPEQATRTSPQARQQPSASSASTSQKSEAATGAESAKQPTSQSSDQSSRAGDTSNRDGSADSTRPEDTQPGQSQRDATAPTQRPDQAPGGQQPRDSQRSGDREADQAKNTAAGGNKMPEQEPAGGLQFKRDQQQPAANRPQQPADQRDAPAQSSPAPRSRPPWNPTKILSTITSGVGNLLRILFLVVIVAVATFFVWKYREQVRQALAQLWRDLQNLWASLWGGRRAMDVETTAPSEQPAGAPVASFASFRDPFASGQAERYTMEELVRYSFEAIEAWGREHGCARGEDQTPLEYAQQLARRHADIGPETQVLADLYCRVAYGREQIASHRRDNLRRLWQRLRAASE